MPTRKRLPVPTQALLAATAQLELTPISKQELLDTKKALRDCDEGEWGEGFHKATPILFEYSNWLATHPSMREPDNRRDFAKKWGLPTGLLNDIEENPEFVRMQASRFRLAGFNRQTHNLVMENLARMATSPRAKAADVELFLAQSGTLKPKVAVQLDGDDLSKMSDDDINAELARLGGNKTLDGEFLLVDGSNAAADGPPDRSAGINSDNHGE